MPHSKEVEFLKTIHQKLMEAEDFFRGTGRTTLFVDSLKDGQVVISHSEEDAQRIKHLAHQKNIQVSAESRSSLSSLRGSDVRYTHTYVTDKLARHVREIQEWLEHLQHNEEKNYD